MTGDRRREARHAVFLRGTVKWPGTSTEVVTTDVSLGGAFLATGGPLPKPGTRVVLVLEVDEDEPVVEMRGRVVRVCQKGSGGTPGLGIQWLGAETTADPGFFRTFLTQLFRTPVEVYSLGEITTWGLDDAVCVAEPVVEEDDSEMTFVSELEPEVTGRRSVVFAPR